MFGTRKLNITVNVKVTEAVVIRDCWWNNTAANMRDKTVSLVRSGHLITSAFHQTASLCVCLCVNSQTRMCFSLVKRGQFKGLLEGLRLGLKIELKTRVHLNKGNKRQ